MAERMNKRREANRRNAQKSTGPKTETGRQISSLNALRHGLAGKHHKVYRALRNENPEDYAKLVAGLMEDCQPVGDREIQAVNLMANAYKRIQRAEAFESAYMDGALEAMQLQFGVPCKPDGDNDNFGIGILLGKKEHQLNFDQMNRYRRNAWADYNKAAEQLRKLQGERLEREKWEEKSAASPAPSATLASIRQKDGKPGPQLVKPDPNPVNDPEIHPQEPENQPPEAPSPAK